MCAGPRVAHLYTKEEDGKENMSVRKTDQKSRGGNKDKDRTRRKERGSGVMWVSAEHMVQETTNNEEPINTS